MARERLAAQPAGPPGRASHPANVPSPSLPIEQIYRLYPGEWVAVKVTALDAQHASSHGEVLAHSPLRGDISAAVIQAHLDEPNVRTFVLHGGPVAYSLEELPRLLDEAEALYPDAWW